MRPSPSPFRVRPPTDPVIVTLDGEKIVAERGEPLAASLVAAGKLTLARSPKFHRPRGPSCFRGACDGCLARVGQTPNLMTCMIPADEGQSVVSQNHLGPREADFLRVTDWFFPEGMNHHELFAGVPGIQNVMQAFARRVAGLGRLPAEAVAERPATRRAVDVVVVGSGPAGMAVATHLSLAGRAVEVLDDQLVGGGGTVALGAADRSAFARLIGDFEDAVRRGVVRLRTRTTAGGVYGRDLLVMGEEGASVLDARAVVFACGAQDGALAFEGNDLPGVVSARAAGMLLQRGVLVGRQIVLVVAEGGAAFGDALMRAVAELAPEQRPHVEQVVGVPVRVRGSHRPRSITVMTSAGERELECDAVAIDTPRAPAHELAQQAGAELVHEPRGYVVRTDRGRIADGFFACGEITGTPFDAALLDAEAERVASRVLAG